jgi:hypothetical protein
MFKSTLILLAALLSATSIQATERRHAPHNQTAKAVASSDADARATSKSVSDADSSSSSQVNSTNTAEGGAATASNAGNAQSTTITSAKNPVNTAVAGIGETTAGCRYHNGGGVQVVGVGLSLGHSSKDKDCERIALAQLMWSRGQDIAGDRIMCKVATVAEALGEDCLALVHELKPAAVTETHNEYVTPAQLGEVEKRIIEKVVTK